MSTIDTLEAGRELDAIVAEKVMGIPVVWSSVPPYMEPGKPFDPHRGRVPYLKGTANGCTYDWATVPGYSTDIAAAWEVVAAVVNRTPGTIQFILSALFPDSGDATAWGAQFSTLFGSDCWSEEADTAPLAICLAALKAIDAPPAERRVQYRERPSPPYVQAEIDRGLKLGKKAAEISERKKGDG